MGVHRIFGRATRIVAISVLAVLSPSLPVTFAQATTSTHLPRVLMCSGSPSVKPSSLHWCSSGCSTYLRSIRWTSWTARGARGVAVRMTNNGVPSCGQGTWTAHPGFEVTLSAPKVVHYCDGTAARSGLLFTKSSYSSPYVIPFFKPPCG